MPNSVSSTAQKLAEAIAFGDVEGAQALLAAFQLEMLNGITASSSRLEREAALEEALRSTRTLLHLARSLRAHASASLDETRRTLGYSAPPPEPCTWNVEA
ncbi:MAG TPA: hypothetical protein VMJ34_11840 [Bryobacteraceae bacterium]|nr:hypothetical protein [Bryobacteraceae bacterium]